MAVTILEALENANLNLKNCEKSKVLMPVLLSIAKEQINNAVILLEKGYDLNEKVEPFLEKYGSVEAVPEKDNEQ